MNTDQNKSMEPAGPRTLKEAMAERGLTAANLAAYFQTDEAHAERWMNHESKLHKKYYRLLRDGFLRMSFDEFRPILEELRSVRYDTAMVMASRRRLRSTFRQGQPRPVNYPDRVTATVSANGLKILEAVAGSPVGRSKTYRKMIRWAVNANAKRIEAMKKLLGFSLEEWREYSHRMSPGNSPCQVLINMEHKLKDDLQWLALANGLSMASMLEKILVDYAELMKINQPKGAKAK